jgi:hypothetical protein
MDINLDYKIPSVGAKLAAICSNKYRYSGKTHVPPAINYRAKRAKPPKGDLKYSNL